MSYQYLAQQAIARKRERQAAERQAKEARLTYKSENMNVVVETFLSELRDELEGVDGYLPYINETQVNVDFPSGKMYLTCSRLHENVRVQISMSGRRPDETAAMIRDLNKCTNGRYTFKDMTKSSSEIATVHIWVMVPQPDVGRFINKLRTDYFKHNVGQNLEQKVA